MSKKLDIGLPSKKSKTEIKQTANKKKIEAGKLVDLNFKVSAEFRREFKLWSVTHDMTQKELLEAAFQQIKQNI